MLLYNKHRLTFYLLVVAWRNSPKAKKEEYKNQKKKISIVEKCMKTQYKMKQKIHSFSVEGMVSHCSTPNRQIIDFQRTRMDVVHTYVKIFIIN